MTRNQGAVFICILGILLLSSSARGQISTSPTQGHALRIQDGPHSLFARVFNSSGLTAHPILVVVLHGDGPPPHENPGYQYIFASKVATQNTNVVAVGLLRPGYTDPQGNHSDGDSGRRDGDNWNARNTDAIADAILKLKLKYEASKVIVAGHSGGAAITANILGRHPQLIDAALLVSCPCGDVNKWRESMLRLTNIPVFKGKIDSLSPITQTKNISAQTRIVLMVGTDDPVAPLNFSNEYREVASKAGKNVTLIKLPGRTHDTFIYSKVFKELSTLISLIDEPGN